MGLAGTSSFTRIHTNSLQPWKTGHKGTVLLAREALRVQNSQLINFQKRSAIISMASWICESKNSNYNPLIKLVIYIYIYQLYLYHYPNHEKLLLTVLNSCHAMNDSWHLDVALIAHITGSGRFKSWGRMGSGATRRSFLQQSLDFMGKSSMETL